MRGARLEADWAPRIALTPRERETQRATASGVWRDPTFQLTQLPDPEPGPGDVVIEVGACGICGSDTHFFETDSEGYPIFSGPARLPVVPGHEFAGRVVAVGAEVRTVRVGELVTAEGMLYCGRCETCRRGRPNQCPNLDMVGFSAPGAFAEYTVIGAQYVWSLEALAEARGSVVSALEAGALVEPISCSYNGIWVAGGGMLPGSHVVVHGCGPIGLGAILLTRAAGAASITAIDPVSERRELARACGADIAIAPDAQVVEQVLAQTRGIGAELHVEAAGAAHLTMPNIERSLAPGGAVVYLGRTGERVPLGLDVLVTSAGRIVGSRGHAGGGCYPNVLRLLESGVVVPDPMISARMGLESLHTALERSTRRVDGKILIARPLT